jgi:hypothetical protein
MKNAKGELLSWVEGTKKFHKAKPVKIVWARITYQNPTIDWGSDDGGCYAEEEKRFVLPPNHTEEELKQFLEELNFEYDDGYGTQELFGTVMLSDGSWLDRREYDGAEWWERLVAPTF